MEHPLKLICKYSVPHKAFSNSFEHLSITCLIQLLVMMFTKCGIPTHSLLLYIWVVKFSIWKSPISIYLSLWVTCSLEEKLWQTRQHIKKQRHYFANKGSRCQSYGFSSSHVWMWELNHKEGWALKNWCFWTVVLENTLESPLDSKEIKPVYPKRNQPWIFTERTLLQLKLQYFGYLMRRAD